MSEILNNFCELNIANYTPDDVERLSAWSIDAYDQIKSLEAELADLKLANSYNADVMEQLMDELAELRKDKARLDWLADKNNEIGNVILPAHCVRNNLTSMRDAIDAAMKEVK